MITCDQITDGMLDEAAAGRSSDAELIRHLLSCQVCGARFEDRRRRTIDTLKENTERDG